LARSRRLFHAGDGTTDSRFGPDGTVIDSLVIVQDLWPLHSRSMQALLAIDLRVAFWTVDSLLMPEASAEHELRVGMQLDRLVCVELAGQTMGGEIEGVEGIESVIMVEGVVKISGLGLMVSFGTNGGSGCCVGSSLSPWIIPGRNGASWSFLDSMKTT
jgi:hypothetical protein